MSPAVTLLGVPNDDNSSFMKGTAGAPPAIRRALHSPSSNLSTESGLDLGDEPRLRDAGDLPPGVAFTRIEEAVAHYEKALLLYPGLAGVGMNLGIVLARIGLLEKHR